MFGTRSQERPVPCERATSLDLEDRCVLWLGASDT